MLILISIKHVANAMRRHTTTCSARLLVILVALASAFCGSRALGASPNIIWIIADDLSPDLGCYGCEDVSTPNIDRLAKQGTRFTNAFATAPVCSSSRSALITGVFQTTTGTHHHRASVKHPLPKPVEPITELFRRAGYFVCNSNATMKEAGKKDYNFSWPAGDLFDSTDWSDRANNQPFFAQVQIHEPHRDFRIARKPNRADNVRIPSYYPDHPVIRVDWANYLASVEACDRKVGRVLKRLEEEKLIDNTIVFFFGDHGRPHYRDKQWLYDGGIRVPLIVSWPNRMPSGIVRDDLVSLIDVSASTTTAAGIQHPSWMQGIDMFSKDFNRSMVFAARDRCGSTRDRIRCVRTDRYKYIRNFFPNRPYTQHSGYKELQYPGMTVARVLKDRGELTGPPAIFWSDTRPTEELYDLVEDPEETKNLFAEPQLAATLIKLRSELDHWMDHTSDQGGVAESLQALRDTIDSSNQWYERKMKQRGLSNKVDPNVYLRWWENKLGLQ